MKQTCSRQNIQRFKTALRTILNQKVDPSIITFDLKFKYPGVFIVRRCAFGRVNILNGVSAVGETANEIIANISTRMALVLMSNSSKIGLAKSSAKIVQGFIRTSGLR